MLNLTDSIAYTGVLNPNLRVFDIIMRTEYGTTYNSYVVRGKNAVAVIETAHLSFYDYFLDNLREALGGQAPDYLVLNHCEPDHTGSVARLLEEYPGLTVVVSPAGAIYIKAITNRTDLNLRVVKDGDVIDLGGKTLKFINAPFLHWPDSMFTWLPEEKALFSCDFLGSHYCEPQVLDTKVVYPESCAAAFKYYYDCIFGPFRPFVQKGLEKIEGLDIAICCTSHGPVLTAGGMLPRALELYRGWSGEKARPHKRIPVFYVSAYGNTGLLAEAIAGGIASVLPDAEVPLFNLIESDIAAMCAELNESDAFLIGSPTINRDAVAPVWQLLAGVEAVGIQKRPAALFGSFGWSGEALPNMAERLRSLKAAVFEPQLKVNFVPSGADLLAAAEFGASFAKTL